MRARDLNLLVQRSDGQAFTGMIDTLVSPLTAPEQASRIGKMVDAGYLTGDVEVDEAWPGVYVTALQITAEGRDALARHHPLLSG